MKTENKETAIEQLQAATLQVGKIHHNMSCLTQLTPDQRTAKRGRGIGPRKLQLMQNRVAAARQHQGLMPSLFDLHQLEQDVTTTAGLSELAQALETMLTSVYDTIDTVGYPAMVTAATAHAHLQVAATNAQRLNPTNRTRKRADVTTSVVPVAEPAAREPAATTNVTALSTKQAA